MSETSRIIGPLLQFFFPEMAFETRQVVHGLVRKAAHFTEYAVLAFLLVRALSMAGSKGMLRWRFLVAFLAVCATASLDEFNQSLSTTRTGTIYDVLLDAAGGAAMIAALWLLGRPRITEEETTRGVDAVRH